MFSTVIARLIKERGCTPTSLARMVGVDDSTPHRWVAGDSMPRVEVLARIVEALRLTEAEAGELRAAYLDVGRS